MSAKRVLVLFSDTGGGHRAAAEAIRAAADTRYPGMFDFMLVDVFRQYTRFPFNKAPELYPLWVNRAGHLWGLAYRLTDHPQFAPFLVRLLYPFWGAGIRRMLREHPTDMILCVHSLLSRPLMQTLKDAPDCPPFVTVVTDLVTTHALWYDPRVTRCLVPTEAAYQRGLHYGLKPEQLRVTGLPVHPDFVAGLVGQGQARQQLGIDPDLPAVLLVSGGEGMGPLFDIAEAVNQKRLPCQLLIVAGRNAPLKERLEANTWHQPTRIYGFVNFMPLLMAAADLLVTKAGPATISEACMAGLPMIISGAIPGQEAGNVRMLVEGGAGVLATTPEAVAEAVEAWLSGGQDERQRRSQNAQALAHPGAVWDIVEELRAQGQSVSQPLLSALDLLPT